MKRIKIMGLCVVAILALGAMMAASASAVLLHEWKECSKASKVEGHYTGFYTTKECTLSSYGPGGEYELLPVTKPKFTSKSGLSVFMAFIPSNEALPLGGGTDVGRVECKKSKDKGEIVNPRLATDTILFSKCTSEGKKCTSPNQKANSGDIQTNLLSITPQLGTQEEGSKVLLLTGPATGEVFAEFSCEGTAVTIYGAVLGLAIGNVQHAVKTGAHLTWQVNAELGQVPVFYQCSESDDDTEICQNFLASYINPPGITLPSSIESLQEFKYTGAIGIYPS
jgi:hypothetical protein